MANKIPYAMIGLFVTLIAFLFIRAFYLFHLEYESSINGLITEKQKGSRGSNYITIKNQNSLDSQTYNFKGREDIFNMIGIGDSCNKFSNSYYVSFYLKREQYKFKDSFEFWHY